MWTHGNPWWPIRGLSLGMQNILTKHLPISVDDYAISPTLFHWQTQNSSKPTSGKGLSYIEHKQNKKTLILFVREQAKDAYGKTMGFVNFGPVELVKYEGSQPMNITWRLKHPMPTYMWHNSAKLAVG